MYNYMSMTSEDNKTSTSPRETGNQSIESEEDPESGFVRGWMNPQRAERRNREIQQAPNENRFQPQQEQTEVTTAATEEEESKQPKLKLFPLPN